MLRQPWQILEDLAPVDPPEGKPPEAHANKLGKQITESIQSDIDRSGEIGATAAANILIDMVRDDRLVVTPNDVQTTAEEYTSHRELSYPEISREIKYWLPYLDLLEVDSPASEEWDTWETIWVAPVFPRLDDISEYIGNPSVISIPTIANVLESSFAEETQTDSSDFPVRDIDEGDLGAFLSYIRQDLVDDWVPIKNTNGLVWVNPARIDEILAAEEDVYQTEEITTRISEILHNTTDLEEDLIPSEVDSQNISPLMDQLEKRFDWNRLATSTEIFWYNDSSQFEQDYREHAVTAQNILYNIRDSSIEELLKARTFFKHNQKTLIKKEDGTTRDQLEDIIQRFDIYVSMREERSRIESSEVGDEMTSTVETRDTTEYHTALEFEEKLERMKEEEEEESIDKGLSEYRF